LVAKPKSPPIKSIGGLQFEMKDGHYYHSFLGKWIAIDSIGKSLMETHSESGV
jgi:hypothetical protein